MVRFSSKRLCCPYRRGRVVLLNNTNWYWNIDIVTVNQIDFFHVQNVASEQRKIRLKNVYIQEVKINFKRVLSEFFHNFSTPKW